MPCRLGAGGSNILLMSVEGELLQEAQRRFNVVDLRCGKTWKLPIALAQYALTTRPAAILSSFWKLNLCACLSRIAYPFARLGLWEHSPPSQSVEQPHQSVRPVGFWSPTSSRRSYRRFIWCGEDVQSITFGLRPKFAAFSIRAADRYRSGA